MTKAKMIFQKNWPLFLMLLPAIIYLIIFNYVPMYGIQIAFRDYSAKKGIWGSDWVGLEHFIKFLNYPNFWLLLKNTLTLSLYNLATFPCAVVFALLINEVKNEKFKKTVQMVSYMPYFLSTVVVVSMLTTFFHLKTGVFNTLIVALGGTRKEFMSIPEYFADIYVWSGVWKSLGWNSIIYIAALSGVSEDLIDASKVDGANRLQTIWHVKIPQILPTVVIMLILSCGQVLGVGFEKVYLMQNSLNLSASQIISTYVYEIGIQGGQFSYSSAIGLFNNVINVIILLCVNKVAKKLSGTGIF